MFADSVGEINDNTSRQIKKIFLGTETALSEPKPIFHAIS